MNIEDLNGKLVAVLGFGQEGKATAAYLIGHGIKPTLFDQKPWENWGDKDKLEIEKLGVNFIFGPDAFLELFGFDVVFRSPGIKSSIFRDRLSEAAIITSQTKFFFDNCPAKIIGVTGTKGKGTTSSLIYEMLKQDVRKKEKDISSPKQSILNKASDVYLTGNIGKVQPLEFLDKLDGDDWVVFELSSFQLQDLDKSPNISVVLMTTAEHLDYHKDVKEYHLAKTPIVRYQNKDDTAIINSDFPASKAIGACGKGKKIFFSRSKAVKKGSFVKDENIVVTGLNLSSKGGQLSGGIFFPVSSLQLKGRHNLENVCASVLAALAAGCSQQSIKMVLKKFKGLEHRLEFVAEKNGVKFYNDSFSTTPETAIAGIEAFKEPEIVILGGSSKNSDFSELGKIIATRKNIKALILVGREADKIKNAVSSHGGFKGKIMENSKNMAGIFKQIKSSAKRGDVVLLSPACASFDMFSNYGERGRQFKQAVKSFK